MTEKEYNNLNMTIAQESLLEIVRIMKDFELRLTALEQRHEERHDDSTALEGKTNDVQKMHISTGEPQTVEALTTPKK
jgi:hypothetical protein